METGSHQEMNNGKNGARRHMLERPASERSRDFGEVPLGYTAQDAVEEAARCLQCRRAMCKDGCPVSIDIPAFIALLRDGRLTEAALKLKEETALPAVCGRVCPQESQCEKTCVLARKGEAIAIGSLERFAADHLRNNPGGETAARPEPTGFSVAVVGAGPAGLTVAGALAKMGHRVVIFEALHEPGGVLMYGIPEFRLPKEIVRAEVKGLEMLGVEVVTDFPVGKARSVEELFGEGFDAVFIGAGAGLPQFLGIPGEALVGVVSANEFLTRVNLMRAWHPDSPTPVLVGTHTVVFGGGNVAVDAARTALRVGSKAVTIVYRRSRQEMPARAEEVRHAEEEGIAFELLSNPLELIGDDRGRVKAVKCVRMALGEPDASGRRRPMVVAGSEYLIEADVAIVAVGNKPNSLILKDTGNLAANEWGGIAADTETGATSVAGVFAGGDIVTGAATVIEAMGAGKRAAMAISEYLARRGKGRAGAPAKP